MKITEKALYTTAEAGAIMCVTAKCVRYYIATRKLRAVQRGDGRWLIHADDIRVYLGLAPDETLVPHRDSGPQLEVRSLKAAAQE